MIKDPKQDPKEDHIADEPKEDSIAENPKKDPFTEEAKQDAITKRNLTRTLLHQKNSGLHTLVYGIVGDGDKYSCKNYGRRSQKISF